MKLLGLSQFFSPATKYIPFLCVYMEQVNGSEWMTTNKSG